MVCARNKGLTGLFPYYYTLGTVESQPTVCAVFNSTYTFAELCNIYMLNLSFLMGLCNECEQSF